MKNRYLLFTTALSVALISCDKHEIRETKFDNGQLKEQFSVLETKDGNFVKDGKYATWYQSGQPKNEGLYENGKLSGNWKNWYSNGQTESEYNYVRDTVDGPFKKWYENGQKRVEAEEKMGKLVGSWTSWYENGQMEWKASYDEAGKSNGTHTKWHKNGQKELEENYLNGIRDGEFKMWDEEGNLYVTRLFKNGLDINLPAVFKYRTNETLELMADETYKATYLESNFFASEWKSAKGKFEIMPRSLKLDGFRNLILKKFNADTIIVTGFNGEKIFVKNYELIK
jgi:antitoxin component YwqK of YwqJK toxin-antitoxin module